MDTDPFDLIGDTLDGQFRVDAFAGEGDLSVVYRGHHLGLDASIAIKCLNLPATLDTALVQPLVDGFKEASRVHYRLARGNLNIAQSIASGATIAPRTGVSVPYLVREWFDGESLASDLARRRTEGRTGRTPEETIALLQPAFDAVAFAQREGVTHLAVNPGNLFEARSHDGAPGSLKVLDFGVAGTMKDLVSGIPAASKAGGLRVLNPAYAAPEQLDKKVGTVGPWTDVYALALVFIECLSDRVVMSESETGALVERALDARRRPTPRAHGLKIPFRLDQALSRAVSLAPAQRQKNAAELWSEITAAVAPVSARRAPFPLPEPPVTGPRPRAPTLVGGVGLSPPAVAGALGHRVGSSSSPSMSTTPMGFEAKDPSPSVEPVVVTAPIASTLESPPVFQEVDSAILAVPAIPAIPRPLPESHLPSPLALPVELSAALPTATASDFSLTAEPMPFPLKRSRPNWGFDLPRRWQVLRSVHAHVLTFGAAAIGGAVIVAAASLLQSREPLAFAAANAARHPPPPPPEPAAVEPAPPEPPMAPFVVSTAWRALFATSRQVADCRRGPVWGGTTATVTFGSDGSVTKIAFRRPFTSSATAACVADVIRSVRTEPFAGDSGVVDFWFYVNSRPR
jgi:serine/threonine protein kinase